MTRTEARKVRIAPLLLFVLVACLLLACPAHAQTFAKGADQYPEGMAPVLVRGEGARVWDVDGNEFVEYGMGMRAVTLGHGYAPVLDAVRGVLADGVSFSRPTVLELAAAEDFPRTPRMRRAPHCAWPGPRPGARSSRCARTSRTSPRRTGSSARSR